MERTVFGAEKEPLNFQNHVRIGKKDYVFEVRKIELGSSENEERTDKLARQIIRIVEETRKGTRGSKT